MADTLPKRDSLNRVKAHHEQYRDPIVAGAERIARGRSYPKSWYEQEKEKLVEMILEELKVLEEAADLDIHVRMSELTEAASSARRLTIYMLIVALVLVFGTSFFTTRGITKPLMVLVEKTKEVSRGIFKGDLNIASPPEVSELSSAFNAMCDKLKGVEKFNQHWVGSGNR
jgi:two-component system sensor histidine kinase GlrK